MDITESEQVYVYYNKIPFIFNCNDLYLLNLDVSIFESVKEAIWNYYYDNSFEIQYGWFSNYISENRKFACSIIYKETNKKYNITCDFYPIDNNGKMKIKITEKFTDLEK